MGRQGAAKKGKAGGRRGGQRGEGGKVRRGKGRKGERRGKEAPEGKGGVSLPRPAAAGGAGREGEEEERERGKETERKSGGQWKTGRRFGIFKEWALAFWAEMCYNKKERNARFAWQNVSPVDANPRFSYPD